MKGQKMNQKFNLNDYETVKSRKKAFYEKYPDGRIIVECLKADANSALFKATLYKDKEEQTGGLALSTGFAMEFKGMGSFANKHAWVENCEESAVGRATDNAGFSTNNKCSREEILKVKAAQGERAVEGERSPAPFYGFCECGGKLLLSKSKKLYCEFRYDKKCDKTPWINFDENKHPIVPNKIDTFEKWMIWRKQKADKKEPIQQDIPY